MSDGSDKGGITGEVIVVTGMSGAGRTQVAKVLEDLDWFVIDNLPPVLFDKVIDLGFEPTAGGVGRLALVADVRGGEFFDDLVGAIERLRDTSMDVRIIFLEADDAELVTRFETTRRRHPADTGTGVLAGIQAERERLSELRGTADLIIDTTNLNVHQLRDRILGEVEEAESGGMRIKVESFGFKHGLPREADLMMDVRFLPNPHWIEHLRPHTGKDEPVRNYVLGHAVTRDFVQSFKHLLDVTVPGYVAEGKRYLTIAIGCTGGKHRSVAIADEIAAHLMRTSGQSVVVQHRDMGAE